ncbi:MAG: anaerobic ribonucleoside-triphosphate reductase activating protein [Clostridia bacterium]|nr:anaerobic ribonucleoside-triphosphate reductase activating protein [Clostridia bacterium]
MIIKGIQKLTLLDYPQKVACTLFTAGCNFRCPFCHNASLVKGDDGAVLNETEVLKYLKLRQGILDAVCITGGEPTLQSDLKEFILKVKELGYCVKLDTNGYKPEVLKELVNEGLLDYVAMDIKNSKEGYARTAGLQNIDINKIEESVDFLMQGNVDYEFRTTVVEELHSESDFFAIAEWLKNAKKYYLQSFKDSGDILGGTFTPCSGAKMEHFLKILIKNIPQTEIR